MKTLTDEEVLLTHDGRGAETKRKALAAIMTRERVSGFNMGMKSAIEAVRSKLIERPITDGEKIWNMAYEAAAEAILACLNRK